MWLKNNKNNMDNSSLELAFEEDVQNNPYSMKSWWRFLDFKQGDKQKERNKLYERALRAIPGGRSLLLSSLLSFSFLFSSFLFFSSLLLSFIHATHPFLFSFLIFVFLTGSYKLWLHYLQERIAYTKKKRRHRYKSEEWLKNYQVSCANVNNVFERFVNHHPHRSNDNRMTLIKQTQNKKS